MPASFLLLVVACQAELEKKNAEPQQHENVTIYLDRPIGAISPYIYGTNDDRPRAWTEAKRHTFGRIGGNRWTAYNWENNASNAGNDWHHQNDGYLSKSDQPGKAVTDRLDVIQKYGTPALVTVPIQGWVAADRNGDGDVAKPGEDYLSKRFFPNLDSSGKPAAFPPNVHDRFVFQNEFVAYLESRRKSRNDPPIWYSLDNEPDLWRQTHARIQTQPLHRQALIERSKAFASAIKAEAPNALIFGPAVSGWMGITSWGTGRGDSDRYFIDEYLASFEEVRKKTGVRLLDVLDVHWYSEHRTQLKPLNGVRVIEDDDSQEVAAARANAARSLFDEGFGEKSWIVFDVLHEPIALLKRLKSVVDRHDPQMKIAITEYYFGGGAHPSGAVAQAEALGAFGKHGVFAANFFHIGKTDDRYILAAFDLYRNYDGLGGEFGDKAVDAKGNDELLGVYAAEGGTTATVVLINRWDRRLFVHLKFDKPVHVAECKRFQVAAPVPRPAKVDDVDLNDLVLPPMSATLIAIPR